MSIFRRIVTILCIFANLSLSFPVMAGKQTGQKNEHIEFEEKQKKQSPVTARGFSSLGKTSSPMLFQKKPAGIVETGFSSQSATSDPYYTAPTVGERPYQELSSKHAIYTRKVSGIAGETGDDDEGQIQYDNPKQKRGTKRTDKSFISKGKVKASDDVFYDKATGEVYYEEASPYAANSIGDFYALAYDPTTGATTYEQVDPTAVDVNTTLYTIACNQSTGEAYYAAVDSQSITDYMLVDGSGDTGDEQASTKAGAKLFVPQKSSTSDLSPKMPRHRKLNTNVSIEPAYLEPVVGGGTYGSKESKSPVLQRSRTDNSIHPKDRRGETNTYNSTESDYLEPVVTGEGPYANSGSQLIRPRKGYPDLSSTTSSSQLLPKNQNGGQEGEEDYLQPYTLSAELKPFADELEAYDRNGAIPVAALERLPHRALYFLFLRKEKTHIKVHPVAYEVRPPFEPGRTWDSEIYATEDSLKPSQHAWNETNYDTGVAFKRRHHVWIHGRSLPLESQYTRFYRLDEFIDGTKVPARKAIRWGFVALVGLQVAHSAMGKKGSSVSTLANVLFSGGNLRDYGISFVVPGAPVLGFVLPPLYGLLRIGRSFYNDAYYLSDKGVLRAQEVLEENKGKTIRGFFPFDPVQEALRALVGRLSWDANLQNAPDLLEDIKKAVHNYSGWRGLGALHALYHLAHGPSSSDLGDTKSISYKKAMIQKASALKALRENYKDPSNSVFRKLYISYLLWKLKGKKIGPWMAFAVGQTSFDVFMLKTIFQNLFVLMTSPSSESSGKAGAVQAGSSSSTPASVSSEPSTPPPPSTPASAPPPPSTPASAPPPPSTPASAPPPAPPTSTSSTTSTTTPVEPPSPPPPPPTSAPLTPPSSTTSSTFTTTGTTTSSLPDSATQLRCLQELLGKFNTFPGDSISRLVSRFASFTNLPPNVELNLSNKGLNGTSIGQIISGFRQAQPGVNVTGLDLSGNFIYSNADFQAAIGSFPPSLRTLTWVLTYSFENIPENMLFGGLGNFNLTRLNLSGWRVSSTPVSRSLTSAFGGMSFLTHLNLSNIDLSGSSFTPGDTTATDFIVSLGQYLTRLQVLDLSYNPYLSIANVQDTQTLGGAISNMTDLRDLRLNNGFLGYLTNSSGVVALLQGLRNRPLRTLHLQENYLGLQRPLGGKSITGIFAEVLSTLTSLQDLRASQNFLHNATNSDLTSLGTSIAQLNQTLQTLYTGRQWPGVNGMPASFPDAFISSLRSLWATRASNATDVFAFFNATDITRFFANHSGTRLDLSGKIGSLDATNVIDPLAAQLQGRTGIQNLDLSDNFLERNGPYPSIKLSAAIQQFPLRELVLRHNIIGSGEKNQVDVFPTFFIAGQTAWSNTLGNFSATLEQLDMSFNGMGVVSSPLPFPLAEGIKQLSKLQVLRLNDNFLGIRTNQLSPLGNAFPFLRNLTTLDLGNNDIASSSSSSGNLNGGFGAFCQNLTRLTGLTSLKLNGNSIGRYNINDALIFGNITLPGLSAVQDLDFSANPFSTNGVQSSNQGVNVALSGVVSLLPHLQSVKFPQVTPPSDYWTINGNGLKFDNFTNPALQAQCTETLYQVFTNSSSSGPQRRAVNPDFFIDREEFMNREDFDRENFATSGASHLAPPQPLMAIANSIRFVSRYLGEALLFWRVSGPSYQESFSFEHQGLRNTRTFEPITPKSSYHSFPPNLMPANPFGDSSFTKRRWQGRPVPEVMPSLDSMMLAGFVTYKTAEAILELGKSSPPPLKTKVIELTDEMKTKLKQAFGRVESQLSSFNEFLEDRPHSLGNLIDPTNDDKVKSLRAELEDLLTESQATKSRLKAFRKDLTWFLTSLRKEERDIRFREKLGTFKRRTKSLPHALESLKDQMPLWLLKDLQQNNEYLHKAVPVLETLPETPDSHKLQKSIEQVIQQTQIAINSSLELTRLSNKISDLSGIFMRLETGENEIPSWLLVHHKQYLQDLEDGIKKLPRVLSGKDRREFQTQLEKSLKFEEEALGFLRTLTPILNRTAHVSRVFDRHKSIMPPHVLAVFQSEVNAIETAARALAFMPKDDKRDNLQALLIKSLDEKEHGLISLPQMPHVLRNFMKLSHDLKARQRTMPHWLFDQLQNTLTRLEGAFSTFDHLKEEEQKERMSQIKQELIHAENSLRFSEKVQLIFERIENLGHSLRQYHKGQIPSWTFSALKRKTDVLHQRLRSLETLQEGPDRKSKQKVLGQDITIEETALHILPSLHHFLDKMNRFSESLKQHSTMPEVLFDAHENTLEVLQKEFLTLLRTPEKSSRKERSKQLEKALGEAQKALDLSIG